MADRFRPVGPAEETERRQTSFLQKLFWFVVIAGLSVACVASVAYLMRAFLFAG